MFYLGCGRSFRRIRMDHAPEEFSQVPAQYLGETGQLSRPQLVPLVAVFGQRAGPRSLEHRQTKSEDVGFRQVAVVFVQDFRGQISAVAFFYL